MLTASSSISQLRKLVNDEIWSFHLGHPITIVEISPLNKINQIVLGNDIAQVIKGKQQLSYTIKAGNLFGAYLKIDQLKEVHDYGIISCTNFLAPHETKILSKNDLDQLGIRVPVEFQFLIQ